MIYNKIIKKIILVLIFTLISCIIFTSNTYATSNIDTIISDAESFLGVGTDDAIDKVKLGKTSNYIYNTLLVIAVAVAVIVGTYLGIKFMLESAEDKAKIKETMIPFIVGCFIIFGAFGIWKVVVGIGNYVSPTPGSANTNYKKENGKLYCSTCGDELSAGEQRRAKCGNCKKDILGI